MTNDPMLNEFLSEAKEHLANVTDDLLALEKVSPDALRYRIDRLFRAMHSIKGAAGFFGFVHITELAHLMETLLRRLREHSLRPDESQLDALLAGSDLILTLLDDVQRSNEVDIRAIRDQLERLVSGSLQGLQLTNTSRSLTVGKAASLSLIPAQPHDYQVVVDLTAFCSTRQQPPLVLIRLLLTFGTLRDGRLEVADHDLAHGLPPGPLLFHAVLASSLDLEQLCSATGLTNEQILRKAEGDRGKEESKPPPVPPSAFRQHPSETTTLRINVALLDRLMNLAGELVLVRNQALQAIDSSVPASRRILQRLNAVTSDLQETVLRTRMQPIGNVFNKFPRIIRDLARSLGKEVDLVIEGQEVELDKSILEMLSDPLTHLIRNCCDHGIETPTERRLANKPETGIITLTARHEGSQIHIHIRDDGKGIDVDKVRRKALQMGLQTSGELGTSGASSELLGLILLPGFTTADRVTDISGRGVGMDVVRTNVEKLGGTLDIDSEPGHYTQFTLRLPLTVAIIPCLLVTVGPDRFAIPQKDLEELVTLFPQSSGQLEYAFDQEVYRLRDHLLPLVRLNEVLASPRKTPNPKSHSPRCWANPKTDGGVWDLPSSGASGIWGLNIVVVKAGRHRYGLIVDQILTTEEVVVKPMQSSLKTLRCYSGATILGDGRVALILELEGIARHANLSFDRVPDAPPAPTTDDRDAQTVLLFRSGPLEQFAVALPMIRRVVAFGANAARDQPPIDQVGDREFVTLDGVTTRLLRLDRLLPVSTAPANEVGYLILPRNVHKPIALLATQILDTVELSTQLDTESAPHEGILGTAVVRGRLTLVLDLFRLADRLSKKDEGVGKDEGGRRKDEKRLSDSSFLLPPSSFPTPSSFPKRRVLLVEDTQFFRLLVKGYLEDQGFEVVTAVNGALGLELLETQQFDLIVSDIEMPVLNGWGFAKAVRERPRSRRLPMLALSTLSSAADKERALRCGFDRYEVKLERDRFLEAVNQLLAEAP